MSLELITGPAGSGKTGEILDRFVASLDREPVLVVPTGADVQRYEEEILFRARVPVGGRVTTFGGLFALVARACGVITRPGLSPVQRELVMAGVARSASLVTLQGPARRSGFPAALDHFIGELQSAMVTPEQFSERMTARSRGPRGGYLAELASLYSGYCDRRTAL
ncbi:MAG: hypothetical protein QOG62_1399, partial [Thermoleophilaceae bacterium]|nr:hypothetical protein [Thermoleophilaceae bacterium]